MSEGSELELITFAISTCTVAGQRRYEFTNYGQPFPMHVVGLGVGDGLGCVGLGGCVGSTVGAADVEVGGTTVGGTAVGGTAVGRGGCVGATVGGTGVGGMGVGGWIGGKAAVVGVGTRTGGLVAVGGTAVGITTCVGGTMGRCVGGGGSVGVLAGCGFVGWGCTVGFA